MTALEKLQRSLRSRPRVWLVTGAAGFIGSNLVEQLLKLNQRVVGLDNFSTGHYHNLQQVRELVSVEQWERFRFAEGDVRNCKDCASAVDGVELVLHQAALGSVPRSIKQPVESHESNVSGTVHMLNAAREAGISRFVYASSSSVYGDSPELPKIESRIGDALSPYAATKLANEIYAGVFARCYNMQCVGLRYFNVFGPRQDPDGAYAAVIPKWISAMLEGKEVLVNGDGETSRDFCHVENVVQANLLAATGELPEASSPTFNVAVGNRTTLNELFERIQSSLAAQPGCGSFKQLKPTYRDFRAGDIRHSLADISAIKTELAFLPTHDLALGMAETIDWYVADHKRRMRAA